MEDYKEHIYALIFCGGGGTRLWPFSREARPKQFLKIKGDKTLIRQTFERVNSLVPVERIFVVTVPDYTDEVAEMVKEVPRDQVLVEPARRNTAMAAALGAAAIFKTDPQAIIANMWSDHLITDLENYKKAIYAGAKAASDGVNLVTTGIKPKYPHTGLGYIKKGKVYDSEGGETVYEIDRFAEKPDIETAKKYMTEGNYLWHQGTFIWRVDTFMDALKKHAKDTYDRMMEIIDHLGEVGGKDKIIKAYEAAPDLSLDVAIAEKAENFLVTEANFEWYDVGDFSVLWNVEEKDENGNAVMKDNGGEYIGLETKDSMIISEDNRMVATYGVNNIVVIATKDAVLVIPKDKAQDVKKIVEKLKEEKKKNFL
jgi:mannose-1-phosphate guanylyltransferase